MMTPDELIQSVCDDYGTSTDDIFGPSRLKRLVAIRSALTKTFKDDWHLNYYEIGRILKRDHKTIMALYKRRKVRLEPPKNAVASVKARLG